MQEDLESDEMSLRPRMGSRQNYPPHDIPGAHQIENRLWMHSIQLDMCKTTQRKARQHPISSSPNMLWSDERDGNCITAGGMWRNATRTPSTQPQPQVPGEDPNHQQSPNHGDTEEDMEISQKRTRNEPHSSRSSTNMWMKKQQPRRWRMYDNTAMETDEIEDEHDPPQPNQQEHDK